MDETLEQPTYIGERWEVVPYRHIEPLYSPDIKISSMIDIGPGIINSEAYQMRKHHPKIECIGIEACLPRLSALKSTYPGELIYAAAHSKKGEIEVFDSGDAHNQPNMVRCYPSDRASTLVRAVTVDEIIETYDLEGDIFLYIGGGGGWETQILEGGLDGLLGYKIKYLALEIWSIPHDRSPEVAKWPLLKEVLPILDYCNFDYLAPTELPHYSLTLGNKALFSKRDPSSAIV